VVDVVTQIQRANAGRDPERLALKYRAMRASPFAFLRGTCALFYARLPSGGIFKAAPLVWACGDLHLENFGSYRGDNGLAYFDINDFDEAALAPASWDLVRFVTSALIAADDLRLPASRGHRLGEVFLEAYAWALKTGKAYWVERDTATGVVKALLDSVATRKRPQFLDSRTEERGGKRTLRVDNGKALAVDKAQRAQVREFLRTFAAAQDDPAFYKMIDVARRIAGTGSLGLERYVVLVRGSGSPDGNHLLDLKVAPRSSLRATLKVSQPAWKTEAHRIAEVQQRLQAVPVALLEAVTMDERAFVLRALQPADDRIDLARADARQLEQLVGTMGQLVAWAQLRSAGRDGSATADELIAFGGRKKWKTALMEASTVCATQVRKDAAVFDAAFDAGAFQTERPVGVSEESGQSTKRAATQGKRGKGR
jgi:uncharacterized protein (DUF2252 family)